MPTKTTTATAARIFIGVAAGYAATQDLEPQLLELPVNAAEQRGDGRAHRLVAHEHNDCDRRQDQRVFRHRLSLRILPSLHNHFRDLFHSRVLLDQFFGRNWPLSP